MANYGSFLTPGFSGAGFTLPSYSGAYGPDGSMPFKTTIGSTSFWDQAKDSYTGANVWTNPTTAGKAPGVDPWSLQGILGPEGWGKNALGALHGLGSFYMGMKQYGLAKDTFNEQKRQFQMNYDAQRDSTNTRLADRQAARYSSDPTFYKSPSAYMDQNRIK